ncbi:MAG: cyclopropane-fatty-acyl-phospholipid synthase family protein [Desulfobulbaceae bacterium]|nr:cyclopropane-fatty-acyl-phospholipid synthase family protein [Desulfobulbaceae bacterium]
MGQEIYLKATRSIFTHIAETADLSFCVRLWDGTLIPLGDHADPQFYISIKEPGVLGTILRKPTLENILLQYASGNIDYHGGDIISFYEVVRNRGNRTRTVSSSSIKKKINKGQLFRKALPLLLARGKEAGVYRYSGDETGRRTERDDKQFVRFHYDLSNDFYQLFLDREMQYSCGYFTGWDNDLETAQTDKLEMICRKLRLQPGERFLDIGCGWGGLVCHAARNHGVHAHGITLSQNQYEFARQKVERLRLQDLVKIELRDYKDLHGEYDKISSIGMYEHVGIANYPDYFSKIRSLLRDRGIFLNHGITRRAKKNHRRFKKITPGRRFILKYIFPGSELDHIGHTLESMEAGGFEIHDVEGWREHYALTTRLWCQRLEMNKKKAIALVGEDRFRMWLAYLAGVSFAFHDGSLRIYQTVATRHSRKGGSTMPPTRSDLYLNP